MACSCVSSTSGAMRRNICRNQPGTPRLAHQRHAAARPWHRPCSRLATSSAGPRPSAALQQQQQQQLAASPAAVEDEEIVGWNWTGSDEFTPLNDRKDAPPLPMPRLAHSQRVVLVRHGQSTWNARNRIQGASNFSVLTELGQEQAAAARKLLSGWDFQALFVSPLRRAVQTAEIVWGGRPSPVCQLASLREIDLYSFQGLDKLENRTLYPDQYAAWQSDPARFEIDGHWPVRELWYRASVAWCQILGGGSGGGSGGSGGQAGGCSLVVAHNAVNQALLCTALGLPPSFFRRFSQSNASFTVIEFEAAEGGAWEGSAAVAPRVRVERVNQFPDRPMNPRKLGRSTPNRLVLVSGDATSPAVQSALGMLAAVGVATPPLIGVGSTAQQALDIRTAVQAALSTPGDGRNVLAVASPATCQQLLGECLGPIDPLASEEERQASMAAVGAMFRMADGGVTIVNWPQGQDRMCRGTILCVNYQAMPEGQGEEGGARQEGEGGEASGGEGF